MTEAAILDALIAAWSSEIRPKVQPNACVLAARAGTAALHYFGVNAIEVAGDIVCFNAAAYELFAAGVPLADWPPHAWSVGACAESPGPGYAGHLIIVTPEHTVDLTAYQFARPQKQLHLPGPVVAADEAVVDAAPWRVWRASETTTCTFRPNGDRSYRNSPDWRKGRQEAGVLIRRMRELLPT